MTETDVRQLSTFQIIICSPQEDLDVLRKDDNIAKTALRCRPPMEKENMDDQKQSGELWRGDYASKLPFTTTTFHY